MYLHLWAEKCIQMKLSNRIGDWCSCQWPKLNTICFTCIWKTNSFAQMKRSEMEQIILNQCTANWNLLMAWKNRLCRVTHWPGIKWKTHGHLIVIERINVRKCNCHSMVFRLNQSFFFKPQKFYKKNNNIFVKYRKMGFDFQSQTQNVTVFSIKESFSYLAYLSHNINTCVNIHEIRVDWIITFQLVCCCCYCRFFFNLHVISNSNGMVRPLCVAQNTHWNRNALPFCITRNNMHTKQRQQSVTYWDRHTQ